MSEPKSVSNDLINFLYGAQAALRSKVCPICHAEMNYTILDFAYHDRRWEISVPICPNCSPETAPPGLHS